MTAGITHMLTLKEMDREPWASCGPASLAALLHRPLAEIRHAFPRQTEESTWTNALMMWAALAILGIDHRARATSGDVDADKGLPAKAWPQRGLVLIQWRGSWDSTRVNHPAQLHRTHWITTAPMENPDGSAYLVDGKPIPFVFDVNLLLEQTAVPASAGWTTRKVWETRFAPAFAREQHRGATGAWWVRAGIEIAAP